MPSRIVSPHFLTVDDWRGIVRNNERIHHVEFVISSEETFLPRILVDTGFFPSTSQVRKNRADLWRDRKPLDDINLQWCKIEVW